jgi:hypothetical protein
MASQLTTALSHISEAMQFSLSPLSDSAPQFLPNIRHNTKWSKLRLNAIPTGKTTTRGAHTPEEAHKALLNENPSYAALNITQKPSWVRDPASYSPGAISFLSVSFEDPNGTGAQNLLRHRTLFAFGHVITVKQMEPISSQTCPQ